MLPQGIGVERDRRGGDVECNRDDSTGSSDETLSAEIMKSPGRAFTEFRFLPFYRDAFRTVLLRKSPDEVARMNGWQFHTDGVHLNSRSGLIVVDLMQEFLET
jgi:hypothetical protein